MEGAVDGGGSAAPYECALHSLSFVGASHISADGLLPRGFSEMVVGLLVGTKGAHEGTGMTRSRLQEFWLIHTTPVSKSSQDRSRVDRCRRK